ncbi:MAG: transcription elongation factor GreA [Candidatus Hydrogenedentes bacterium]|nr:transcription elongation factor GreA [Candidatus Hydrogenedentota bacterium]
MTDTIYISRDGLEKLIGDLERMKAERLRIADTIESARDLGDLKENAEYHAAKEAQAHLHARIRDVEDKIARASIIEDHDIDASKAFVGATVRAVNKKTGKEVTYILVSPVEADMATGKISTKSPVGKAFLGASVGDIVVAEVPAGDLTFEVIEISR